MGDPGANTRDPIADGQLDCGLIVHEWLELHGGAERVVGALLDAFPEAGLACLWSDLDTFHGRKVNESILGHIPGSPNKALLTPLMPLVWRTFPRVSVDWMIVSSHAFAHQVPSRGARKYVYVHSPARYLWAPEHDPRGAGRLARAGATILRPQDRRAARRDDSQLIANSAFIAERIEKAWHREARVIYPPVDVRALQSTQTWSGKLTPAEMSVLEQLPSSYVMGASRLVQYKALDGVLATGEALGLPVVIAGAGPDETRLRTLAASSSVPVTFLGAVSDALLYAAIQGASIFAFPPVEDFGILPVEAMALGTPVLVNPLGGAAESLAITGFGATADFGDRDAIVVAAASACAADRELGKAAAMHFDRGNFMSSVRDLVVA